MHCMHNAHVQEGFQFLSPPIQCIEVKMYALFLLTLWQPLYYYVSLR